MKSQWLLGAVLASLVSVTAAAQDVPPPPRLAIAAAERGLAIGRYNLLIGGEAGISHVGGGTYFGAVLPLRFGITEDLEIFAAPVVQSVDPVIHEPAIGLLYRFTHGDVEVGARVAADLAAFGPEPTQYEALLFGVPVRLHFGRHVALDVGAQLSVTFNAPHSQHVYLGMLLPVAITVNFTDAIFATISSGLLIPNFELAGDTIGAPLGVAAGYTVADGDHPLVDLGARVAWDNLRTTDTYLVLAFARFYVYP